MGRVSSGGRGESKLLNLSCSHRHSVVGWVEEGESDRWGEVQIEGWEIIVEKGVTDIEEGRTVVEIALVGIVFAEVVGCRD